MKAKKLNWSVEPNGTAFAAAAILFTCLCANTLIAQTRSQVFAWNNLGMHCMDDDFSVFTILPPYNVFHAQVVVGTNGTAHLASNTGGFQVNYQAVTDADGSINTTSIRKSNFWEYVTPMLGLSPPPDTGLELGPEFSPAAVMPGTGNPLQPMTYVPGSAWYAAWGVPITPYDDDLQLNPYPMMHVVTSGGGFASASTDIVLPVSTEMDCRACHASGSGLTARPDPDWEWNPVPTIDYRLNILRLHDQHRFATVPTMYTNILSATGFNTEGLYASVVQDGRPVLCAICHLSEAVPDSGYPGLAPLTTVVHGHHASVIDPSNGMTLGASSNRTSCYRCHPGEDTRCLRGAMGRAVAADGTLAIQCQDCHGGMSLVGDPARTGWLDEPTCQACHSGDAVKNSGQIRYNNVFVSGTTMRDPANARFATNPDTPAAGLSLYRFSRGHGGLYCSACHGSTHAIYPSAFGNDNVASIQQQNYEGTISECSSCHGSDTPAPSSNTFGGPHGMHRLNWVSGHKNPGKTLSNCQTCHGTDNRGTVLSRSFKDQTLYGQTFWRGRRIGCYECHGGPVETGHPPAAAPTASDTAIGTMVNWPVNIGLTASTTTLRIVSQPKMGTVALNGTTATYIPANGFIGTDSFTFCSDSGYRESNLATVTVTVNDVGPCMATLSSTDLSFDELSHVGEIQVSTGVTCPWTAASETLWINLISRGGQAAAACDSLWRATPTAWTA